ncbi:hypothetical protein GCM10027615_64810 [Plantactinospora veratri]
MTQGGTDPSWDPAVHAEIRAAINHVLFTARDVLMRYSDEDCFWVPPSEVSDAGDATGFINAARNQVLHRLQSELDQATATLDSISTDVRAYKQRSVGLTGPESSGD